MILLASKTINQNMPRSLEKFNNYFETKKIKYTSTRAGVVKTIEKQNDYKIDYDVLALEVLSGESAPTSEAQRKVIFSLKDMTEAELLAKGGDMLVAFSLLGMELVVINLGEKLINITDDVKQRASIHYTCAVAMYENQQFHKVIDIVNDIIDIEPLLTEEVMAFEYLKAEALFKLNRVKEARAIFTKIKKWNPHFRLVRQRLTEIEAP
jgi:tetratricopeptide (TPR) repeat protein